MAKKIEIIPADKTLQTVNTPTCEQCKNEMIFIGKGLFHDKFQCKCSNQIGIPNTKNYLNQKQESDSDFGSGATKSLRSDD